MPKRRSIFVDALRGGRAVRTVPEPDDAPGAGVRLQALTSKLEAIEAYDMYAEDEGVRDLFERLARDERAHADALLAALRERLARG